MMILVSISFSETKIGYIDSQIIMSEYEDVRQVQVELEKEQKRLQTVYEKKLVSLDSLKTAYQTGSIILSEQKKIQMENNIRQKEQEIQQWQLQYFGPEGELYKLQNQLLAPILNTIDSVIKKIGEERSYDYIFDAVQGSIVYALDSHNLTQEVLDELKKVNIDSELKNN
jgi:outer membrane protein